jgi:predicted AAA+ superfamily ATPase
VGGAKVDLIVEDEKKVHAIEIKNTKNPAKKDIRNLKEFVAAEKKNRRGYLLYRGETAYKMDGISVLPVAHLFRSF